MPMPSQHETEIVSYLHNFELFIIHSSTKLRIIGKYLM